MINFKTLIPLILQRVMWIPTRLIFNFFVHLNVVGVEKAEGLNSPIIISSNHASELDPIIVAASLPFFSKRFPLMYTSREKGFYSNSGIRQIFYGGALFKAVGAYSVEVGKQDYSKSLATHREFLNKGFSLCIFPEGGITQDGKFKEFKGGVSYLAESTGFPVIPVLITGNFNISLKDFLFRKRSVKVVFGDPVYVKRPNDLVGSLVEFYKIEAKSIRSMTSQLSEYPQDFI